MKKWTPVDFIIGFLAVLVAVILGIVAAIPLYRGMPLSGEKAKIVVSTLSAIVSMITLYVGAKLQESRDKSRKSDDKNRRHEGSEGKDSEK